MIEYCFPKTSEQKKRNKRLEIENLIYGILLGLFCGVVLGYAWRMAQLARQEGEMKMTFQEAKNELLKLANGQFNSISYELTTFHTGETQCKCEVYLDGYGFSEDVTWEKTLNELKQKMGVEPKSNVEGQEP